MRRPAFYILLFCSVMMLMPGHCLASSAAGEGTFLKGRIVDIEGQVVRGARIYLYESPDVRRPADFISDITGKDGGFSLALPAGRYWAVARYKKAEGYGPLMPGDKHSGEPMEIELVSGVEFMVEFIVKDLKEAAGLARKAREDFVTMKGKITDAKGLPVKMAYVIADRKERTAGIPDYVSSWSDEAGSYTLYLPRGTYHIGCARKFPPDQTVVMEKTVEIGADKMDLDITCKSDSSG